MGTFLFFTFALTIYQQKKYYMGWFFFKAHILLFLEIKYLQKKSIFDFLCYFPTYLPYAFSFRRIQGKAHRGVL